MTVSESRWQNTPRKSSPSASSQAGAVLSLARLWARLPTLATIRIKKIGDVLLEPDLMTLVDGMAQQQIDGMAWFQLGRATERAWVGVTLKACLGLIRAVLGGADPQIIRPLSSGEAGLMAAFVSSGLQSMGLAHRVTVSLSPAGPPLGGRQVLLGAALRGGAGIDGRVLFVGPWAWLGAGPQPPTMPAQDTVEACLELGRTLVPAADLQIANLGDAIVFDGIAGMNPGDSWPANFVLGDQLAPARLDPEGDLILEDSWSHLLWGTGDAQEPARPAPSPEVFDSNPSEPRPHREVVAEIGHVSVSRKDLVTLIKGEGLLLGPRPSDLLLRVDGRPWATGKPGVLGGQLAIRILQRLAI